MLHLHNFKCLEAVTDVSSGKPLENALPSFDKSTSTL